MMTPHRHAARCGEGRAHVPAFCDTLMHLPEAALSLEARVELRATPTPTLHG